jgi:hypothetical protein
MSVIHIIPVLALVLFLGSNANASIEASQVGEFVEFYFCTLYHTIFGISLIRVSLFILYKLSMLLFLRWIFFLLVSFFVYFSSVTVTASVIQLLLTFKSYWM